MAATTPAQAMLPTILLRPCQQTSYPQLQPSGSRLPIRQSTAQTPHYLFARADANGANKQQPHKSSTMSSAFERAAAYKESLGKATSLEGKPSNSPTDFNSNPTDFKLQEEANFPASPPQDRASPGVNSFKSKQESEMISALAAKAEARKAENAARAEGREPENKAEARKAENAARAEGREAENGQVDTSQGLEVEIITRDGIIRRKVTRPGETFSKTKVPMRTVSSSAFMGLGFSDKKPSGKGALPAGLAAPLKAPPPGSLPTVEIITRDGKAQQGSKDGLYKPKVVTWGVFERPANISETYGGGRTIKPGDQLETEEEKKAREARTKELLRAYHKKIGLDVDPQIKADCAKALNQGNELFERGYIQRAIEQFEKVMQQMPYQSELHGSAALQWAISMDSANRYQEAKAMYENIVSHPNDIVRKKAKRLLYGFQAMDNLKVTTTSKWDASVYSKYFGAFSDGYNSPYVPNEEDTNDGSIISQDFVYLGLLLFPLVLFLLTVALKGR